MAMTAKKLQLRSVLLEEVWGPALHHLDFYREIQRAGKIVHVQVQKNDIAELVRKLDPDLMVLDTRCDSIEEGKEILSSVSNLK